MKLNSKTEATATHFFLPIKILRVAYDDLNPFCVLLSKVLLNTFSFFHLCNSFSNNFDNAPIINFGMYFSANSWSFY